MTELQSNPKWLKAGTEVYWHPQSASKTHVRRVPARIFQVLDTCVRIAVEDGMKRLYKNVSAHNLTRRN